MSTNISDPALGTSSTIGRYFGLVSAVPTLLLTAYLFLLVGSGAWIRRPDLAAGLEILQSPTWAGAFGLLGAALAAALILHTVQFAIVQFLEGYWGGNPVMRFLRAARIAAHVNRQERARRRAVAAHAEQRATAPGTFSHLRAKVDHEEAISVRSAYPERTSVLPTRLGNLLRRHEKNAGRGYDIDILRQATHLMLVAPPHHVEYVNDQRIALDLAVRLCASGIIATVATVVVMWPWDVWLLLALVPYAAAYVSYRGALIVAQHYGAALSALVDLNRFRMYEAMHLTLPADTAAERELNRLMAEVIAGFGEEPGDEPSIAYDHTMVGNELPPDRPSTGG